MQIHPCSVNFNCTKFESPWLVYAEMVSTSAVYLRDCTMVGVEKCGIMGDDSDGKLRGSCVPQQYQAVPGSTVAPGLSGGGGGVPQQLPQLPPTIAPPSLPAGHPLPAAPVRRHHCSAAGRWLRYHRRVDPAGMRAQGTNPHPHLHPQWRSNLTPPLPCTPTLCVHTCTVSFAGGAAVQGGPGPVREAAAGVWGGGREREEAQQGTGRVDGSAPLVRGGEAESGSGQPEWYGMTLYRCPHTLMHAGACNKHD